MGKGLVANSEVMVADWDGARGCRNGIGVATGRR